MTSFYKLTVVSLIILGFSNILSQPKNITLDFETGNLRGWTKSGDAFTHQPTFGDNCKFRNKQSGHQGNYWIGTFENYQGKQGENFGNTQGDSPTGKLISPIFTIPSGTLSFLVGGGRDSSSVFVELVIIEGTGEFNEKTAFRETGENRETMRRVTWNLNPHSNKQGRIRIVDASSEPWGHINVDDFKFTPISIVEVQPINPQELVKVDNQDKKINYQISLEADRKNIYLGEDIFFRGKVKPTPTSAQFKFDFGDETNIIESPKQMMIHSYKNSGDYEVSLNVQIRDKNYTSNKIIINVHETNLELILENTPPVFIGQPVHFSLRVKNFHDDMQFQFHFGDGKKSEWNDQFSSEHVYENVRTFRAYCEARIGDKTIAKSNVIPIKIISQPKPINYELKLEVVDKSKIEIGAPARFRVFLNPETSDVEYNFDFGDNTKRIWTRQFEIEHFYKSPGLFKIHVIARKGADLIAKSKGEEIEVIEIDYQMRLFADQLQLSPGEVVEFWGEIEPASENVNYKFNFGDEIDNDWLDEPIAEHTFMEAGEFPVQLTTEINGKEIQSNIVTITVEEIEFRVLIEAEPTHASPGHPINFRAIIEPNVEEIEYQFIWAKDKDSGWLNDPEVEHVFMTAGEFPVRVTARINGSEIHSDTIMITVEEIEFRAFVQAEPEHALPGQPIKFEAIIEPFVGGVEYQFIFGNKKKSDWSFNSTAHHSYSEIGIHEVSVKVRRDNKIISVSEPLTIEIIKTAPSTNLYLIIGGVLIIFGGGYLLIKKLSGRKKIVKTPSYSIHINPEMDIGNQKIESNVQLNPNMELRFKPVKDIGKQTIETEDSSIND